LGVRTHSAEVEIVSNDHHGFQLRIAIDQVSKVFHQRVRAKGGRVLQLSVEADFIGDQGSRLGGALARAGDDCVPIDVHTRQRPPHFRALLDALVIQRSFFILSGIGDVVPRARAAQGNI
jgi:hypothetical protein